MDCALRNKGAHLLQGASLTSAGGRAPLRGTRNCSNSLAHREICLVGPILKTPVLNNLPPDFTYPDDVTLLAPVLAQEIPPMSSFCADPVWSLLTQALPSKRLTSASRSCALLTTHGILPRAQQCSAQHRSSLISH